MGSGAIVPLATAGRHYIVTPYRCNFQARVFLLYCAIFQQFMNVRCHNNGQKRPKITTVILIIIPETLCIFAPKLII